MSPDFISSCVFAGVLVAALVLAVVQATKLRREVEELRAEGVTLLSKIEELQKPKPLEYSLVEALDHAEALAASHTYTAKVDETIAVTTNEVPKCHDKAAWHICCGCGSGHNDMHLHPGSSSCLHCRHWWDAIT